MREGGGRDHEPHLLTSLKESMINETRCEFGPFHLSERDYTKIQFEQPIGPPGTYCD